MTLTRKGSRTIVVDGAVYRWKIRHRCAFGPGHRMRYPVELASDGPTRLLMVDTGNPHPRSQELGWPVVAVRPSDVAAAVREARRRGWDPAVPGAPFVLAPGPEPGAGPRRRENAPGDDHGN